MKTVIKRDGRSVPFDHTLIDKAILAAMKEVDTIDSNFAIETAKRIANICPDTITVEEIQNLVEEALMASQYKDVARAYICYRNNRNKARNRESDQIILSIIRAEQNDVTRENANMNADTPAGMVMKIASERSKDLVDDYLISEEAKKAVDDNILHIHDKDYYPTRSLTCLQHPVDKILRGGFQAGHGESRPAKRIETASILSCISMESVQNVMHGGQAIPAFDFYMAPYVRITFLEEIKKLESVNNVDLSGVYDKRFDDYFIKPLDGLSGVDRLVQHAMNETVRRVHQSMEAFVHNLNTIHSRGGNQVVFSSINYGTDTSAEGRCVIRELLLTTEKGIGNGSTAIFPIQIWKKKRGVSYLPEDPNYDLYKLACQVTAKRFFPNFLNLDAPFNQHEKWRADDPERYMYEVATMGCVDGKEVVTYCINDEAYTEPIEVMWNRLSRLGTPQSATLEGFESGHFIDLENVKIMDRTGFVDCLRIIKNPDKHDWMRVTLSNGRVLTCTSDHPWSVNDKGVVFTNDLCLGDKIEIVDSTYEPNSSNAMPNSLAVKEAWLKGFIVCDGCYDHQMMCTVGLDEEDVAKKYISCFEDVVGTSAQIQERHRGKKGDYLELKASVSKYPVRRFISELLQEFKGLQKAHRQIPVSIFRASFNERMAFLAGMIDADGYINSQRDRAKVQIGSVNKALAIQTMLLAQSLGMPAKLYVNYFKGSESSAIRWRVEFDANEEIVSHMACGKKRQKMGVTFEPIHFSEGEVIRIEKLPEHCGSSYDVTTTSEHFNISGIRSHNCRTRVFENRHGEKTSVGRGNLSFSTINLPGLALSVMGIEDREERIKAFYDKLYAALNVTAKQLLERYEFQCTAQAKQFPLLMQGLWVGSENLKSTDEVREVLKQGTLGIGFIGLAECLVALIGKHHGESDEAQKLGLNIIQTMCSHVKVFSIHYDMNFSVLATPAEGLSGKFTKKDRKKYGVVPGVTDREYYTNSNHVPVYYKCSAAHKARIEAPYHEKTRGGHIFYVELDGDATHNVQAVMDVVDLMDKYNIGYGSINHNRNRCLECGYEDAQKGLTVCPKCGSTHIDAIQRITGYLVGTTDRWNHAKLSELRDRETHE